MGNMRASLPLAQVADPSPAVIVSDVAIHLNVLEEVVGFDVASLVEDVATATRSHDDDVMPQCAMRCQCSADDDRHWACS